MSRKNTEKKGPKIRGRDYGQEIQNKVNQKGKIIVNCGRSRTGQEINMRKVKVRILIQGVT